MKPDEVGPLLFRFFQSQQLEGFERSFKMSRRTLLANRVLIGAAVAAKARDEWVDLVNTMGMPRDHVAAFGAALDEADIVHVGYEESEAGFLCKAYLEYAARYRLASQGNLDDDDALLLHVAWKWDLLNPAHRAIARYVCYPRLSAAGRSARIEAILDGASGVVLEATKNILALASIHATESPMYLEVSEDGNPRKSFDINLHAAGLHVVDIEGPLTDLCRYFEISPATFGAVRDAHGGATLGHISGGVSRDGEEFFTVYHEQRGD